jgi:NAD(P)-dependent dehydrogenase (short-subunit alcohol dehydrogenase family)
MKTFGVDLTNGRKALVLGVRHNNIGGAICREIAKAGWSVYGDDCQADPTIDRYEAPPGSGWHQYKEDRRVPYEDFDMCVITVGTTHMEPFGEVSKTAMDRVIEGSLILPLECARRYVQAREADPRALRGSTPSHHSTIIFIGSYAYNHVLTHSTAYCAAKAGLVAAASSLAWELMPEGFHVHIINPHHVQNTPMTERVRKSMGEDAEAKQRKDLRMPDLLTPEEIAQMVVTIVDNPHMGWCSGQPINMFGGVR